MRGTYDALGHPAVIEHLVRLGITAIELLPIHAFVDDRFLVEKGLRNYWGYSTLAYFAPEPRYLGNAGTVGLKSAMRALHDAGIEVILDVVYNHTCEGNHLGPTLSFRGIDNAVYYKLSPDNPRFYWDSTGTGNTLEPQPSARPADGDGFAAPLGRGITTSTASASISPRRSPAIRTISRTRAAFLQACAQDPVLCAGEAHRRALGRRPGRLSGRRLPDPGWGEWNDQFRDTVRGFWRGDPGQLPKLTQAMTGSREIFEPSGRQPWASVNFVDRP